METHIPLKRHLHARNFPSFIRPVAASLAALVIVAGCGGGSSSPTPSSNLEQTRAIAMPFARAQHAAVPLADGRVLILGGRDESRLVSRLMHIFDPRSETFSAFASLGEAGPFAHAAVALADGKVLVAGGVPSSAAFNAVLVDVRAGTLTPTAGLETAVPAHSRCGRSRSPSTDRRAVLRI